MNGQTEGVVQVRNDKIKESEKLYPSFTQDALVFYDNFILEQCMKDIEVIGSRDIRNEYTLYQIRVNTSYVKYTVERRFKQFKELRKKLIDQHFKNPPQLEDIILKRFSLQTKEKRKVELQKEFKEKKVDALLSCPLMVLTSEDRTVSVDLSTHLPHERKVLRLLQQIQASPEKRRASLKQIGEIISNNPPITNTEFIILIMRGTGQVKEHEFKGMVQLCGLLDPVMDQTTGKNKMEHINCKQNLEILNGLLECEKNQNYEQFLKEFQEVPYDLIGSLRLDSHILSEKACKMPALKIFSKFAEGLKRAYNSTNWRTVFAKQKLLRYKKEALDEIEAFISGKTLGLKRVTSSTILNQLSSKEKDAPNRMTLSTLHLSYLDSSMIEGEHDKTNLWEVIDNERIEWHSVYMQPEKYITVEQAFPVHQYVKMTVILPVLPHEALEIISNSSTQWDQLLLLRKSVDKNEDEEKKVDETSEEEEAKRDGRIIGKERFVDTYNWGFTKRIQFMYDRMIEMSSDRRVIHISKIPIELCQEDLQDRFASTVQHGLAEQLIRIRALDSYSSASNAAMNPSHSSRLLGKSNGKQSVPSIGFCFGSVQHANQLPSPQKYPRFTRDQSRDYFAFESEERLSKDDPIICEMPEYGNTSEEESNHTKNDENTSGLCFPLTNPPHLTLQERDQKKKLENQKGDDEATTHTTIKTTTTKGKVDTFNFFPTTTSVAVIMDKDTEIHNANTKRLIEQEQEDNMQSSSLSSSNSDRAYLTSLHTIPAQIPVNQTGSSSTTTTTATVQQALPIQQNEEQGQQQQQPPQQLQLYQQQQQQLPLPVNTKRRESGRGNSVQQQSIFGIGSMKKFSDDFASFDMDSPTIPSIQGLSQTNMSSVATGPSAKCEVTFITHLMNSEAVHFFSKFIVNDDDTLIQNMKRLLDLAKKARKESASTAADSCRHASATRKSSNDSAFSYPSENSIYMPDHILEKITSFGEV